MTTTTIEERLREIGRRIDGLQRTAKSMHGKAKAAAQGRVDQLKQKQAAAKSAVAEKQQSAEDQLEELEARVEISQKQIAADAAQDKDEFVGAVQEELHEWDGYFERLHERFAAKAEPGLTKLRERRAAVGVQLGELRGSSAEAWQKVRTRVDEQREALASAADKLASRLHKDR